MDSKKPQVPLIETRMEFTQKVFEFFRVQDLNGSLLRTYDIALCCKHAIDWQKFYEHIVKTTEKRVLPMPKYFADNLSRFIKQEEKVCADEGCVIQITFTDDSTQEFVVSNSTDKAPSLKEIQKRYAKVDRNDKTKKRIKKIVQYPKGTSIVGGTPYFDTHIYNWDKLSDSELRKAEEEKERAAELQVKTLFRQWE